MFDIAAEARKYGELALRTLVEVAQDRSADGNVRLKAISALAQRGAADNLA